MIILDENDNTVNINEIEKDEQDLASMYVNHDDIVFELGARYGSVSVIVNKKLSDKKAHVVVEPDQRVWDALEKNKKNNDCEFHIVKGFVSNKKFDLTNTSDCNGYGTTCFESTTSVIPSYPFNNFNLPFNVLIADCEGFLEIFFDENPGLYSQLRLVIFEADYPGKCNYEKIKTNLLQHGFEKLCEGHQNVFKKSCVILKK